MAGLGAWLWAEWKDRPPTDQWLRGQFESHKADYIQFAKLLRNDRSAKLVDNDGSIDIDAIHKRQVPEYRTLIRRIEVKNVTISEDGSMEFALWGHGCAICSDSYMGVLYFPKDHTAERAGWVQTVVNSLDDARLPQEHGSVATGLYVVAIEPEWFIYRLEYQE